MESAVLLDAGDDLITCAISWAEHLMTSSEEMSRLHTTSAHAHGPAWLEATASGTASLGGQTGMLTLLVSAPRQPLQAAGAKRLHHEYEGCIGAARMGRNARLHHDVALALGPQGQRQWLQHHHRAERWQLRVTESKPLRVGPHAVFY